MVIRLFYGKKKKQRKHTVWQYKNSSLAHKHTITQYVHTRRKMRKCVCVEYAHAVRISVQVQHDGAYTLYKNFS